MDPGGGTTDLRGEEPDPRLGGTMDLRGEEPDPRRGAPNLRSETAAVLVGGLGTRLRSAVPDLPKPLAPVRGEPFLARLLRWLGAQGVGRALLLCGHGSEALDEFRRGWSARGAMPALDCSVEPAPLGTGGAVRHAVERLPEEFFLTNGDSLCPIPLSELLREHREARAELTLTAIEQPARAGRGALELARDGRVLSFAEKSEAGPGWINAGVYRCRRALFEREAETAPGGGPLSLERELLPRWIAAGRRIHAFRARAPFLDIGTPEDWARAQSEGWLP